MFDSYTIDQNAIFDSNDISKTYDEYTTIEEDMNFSLSPLVCSRTALKKCNNNDETICLNDDCVKKSDIQQWMVAIDFEGLKISDLRLRFILEVISEATGISAEEMEVASAIPTGDSVMQIYIIVPDQKSAYDIKEIIQKCSSWNMTDESENI